MSGSISAIAGSGLVNTASAIAKAQNRFDKTAEALVDDSLALDGSSTSDTDALGAAAPDGSDDSSLISDTVSLQSESLMNQILYGVFTKQADQQQSLLDILKPKNEA